MYPAGQLIAGVAASEDWCATVLSGVIKLSKTLSDGRQQIVALLFPGDFLGRPFRAEFPYTAETATEVQLCCYGRAYFEGFMQEQSDLKQIFLERTLDSVDAARDWMLLLGRKTAQEKVAALLLTILQRTSRPCPDCEHGPCRQLIMPLTRTEMADYLGLRLETVSRQLKQLEAIGNAQEARSAAYLGAGCRRAGQGSWPGLNSMIVSCSWPDACRTTGWRAAATLDPSQR